MKTATFFIALFLLLLSAAALDCAQGCVDCTQVGCTVCAPNYEATIFGTCSNAIDKCVIYGPDDICFNCQPTYDLQGQLCVKKTSGCLAFNGGMCTECGFGTRLDKGLCTGVLNCASTSDTCEKCRDGYALRQNVCVDTSAGCAGVSEKGACLSCKEGYFMSGLKCFEAEFNNPKCYILADNDNCLICKTGLNLEKGQCLFGF